MCCKFVLMDQKIHYYFYYYDFIYLFLSYKIGFYTIAQARLTSLRLTEILKSLKYWPVTLYSAFNLIEILIIHNLIYKLNEIPIIALVVSHGI